MSRKTKDPHWILELERELRLVVAAIESGRTDLIPKMESRVREVGAQRGLSPEQVTKLLYDRRKRQLKMPSRAAIALKN